MKLRTNTCAPLLALLGLTLSALATGQPVSASDTPPADWSERFVQEVDRRLDVPVADRQRYIALLQQALVKAETSVTEAQAFVLVDRSPQVQAAFVIMRTPSGEWQWTGASLQIIPIGRQYPLVDQFDQEVAARGARAAEFDQAEPEFTLEQHAVDDGRGHVAGFHDMPFRSRGLKSPKAAAIAP